MDADGAGSGVSTPLVLEPDRFSGSGWTTAGSGEVINIRFTNPDLANKKVTIIVHGGREEEKTVEIPLDGKGKGTTEFPVPAGWIIVVLTHTTSSDHTIIVGGP